MTRRSFLPTLLGFVLACTLLPAAAFAAAPPSGPAPIVSEGFEDGVYEHMTIDPIANPFPAAAWWGPITQRHSGGSKGLWCAGSSLPTSWPVYPELTQSEALFSVPELIDYYSSSVSFKYTMPSFGAEDSDSFAFSWRTPTGPTSYQWDYHHFAKTSDNAWSSQAFSLTQGTTYVNLSRTPGEVKFQFIDVPEGAGQTLFTGQGVTIDDVLISGFKYGPVKTLTAQRTGDSVHLSWAKPAASTATSSDDGRSLTYRVWRAENVAPLVWTELTSTRQTGTTYDDSGLEATKNYRYFVQAWDTGTDPGYGVGYPSASSGSGLATVAATTIVKTDRIAGIDRIATALQSSFAGFPLGAPAVVVASGSSWTDALPASALAGTVHGPLLLVRSTSLDASVTAEINRLGATTIYVVGNTTSVNSTVRNALKAIPGKSVVEVGGTDVYSVGQLIAARVKTLRGGTKGGTVYVARSDVFADALAASSLAAAQKAPIILVPKTGTIPAAAKTALQNIGPATVVICGSESAVYRDVATQLKTITGKTPIRNGGLNRFETAKLIIDYGTTLLAPAGPDGIYVATGWNFPDALAGGVLAGASADGKWRPLMTTDKVSLSPPAAAYMDAHHTIKWARILGSDYDPVTKNGALDDAVVTAVGMHIY